MKSGNVTLQEEEEIKEMFQNGQTIGEIAIIMDRSVGTIIRVLAKLKLIKETDYTNLVEMPLEWVKEWLAIYKRYGKHETRM